MSVILFEFDAAMTLRRILLTATAITLVGASGLTAGTTIAFAGWDEFFHVKESSTSDSAKVAPSQQSPKAQAGETQQRLMLKNGQAVNAFYASRNGKPYWTRSRSDLRKSEQVLKLLQDSWTHGLNPETYHASKIAALLQKPTGKNVQTLELLLSDAVAQYGRDMTGMRVNPANIGQQAKFWRQPISGERALFFVTEASNPAAAMEKFVPTDALYAKLRQELVRLARQQADGGQDEVIRLSGPALKPGARDAAVPALRQFFGLPASGDQATLYDDEMAERVAAFQRQHNLKGDSVIGAKTLSLINRSPRDKMEQIVANLERLRWMQQNRPGRYVLVNIPSQTLWAVDGGKIALEMPVVVGKPERATEAFTTEITGVRFNPRWHVPQTIKEKDFLPDLRQDPYALEKKGIRIFRNMAEGKVEIDPASVDWAGISANEMKSFQMVQDSGDKNALGRVRVLMPNEFDIYLHDTNHRESFSEDERMMSSGCIRLFEPEKMADYILNNNPGWSQAKTDEAIAAGKEVNIPADQKIPVYIVYLTSWVDTGGKLVFGPDPYNQDKRLIDVLKANNAFALPGSNGQKFAKNE